MIVAPPEVSNNIRIREQPMKQKTTYYDKTVSI